MEARRKIRTEKDYAKEGGRRRMSGNGRSRKIKKKADDMESKKKGQGE